MAASQPRGFVMKSLTRMGASIGALIVALAAGRADAQAARGANATVESSGDIVVTAQKTGEQRLVDTPLSVTAITGTTIDRSAKDNIAAVLQSTPGLSSTTGAVNGVVLFQIRGSSSIVGDATVGLYYDDLPFTSLNFTYGPEVDPFDLSRIEVLRGPQGTLYGASSSGGTVRILTNNANTTKIEAKGAVQLGFQDGGGTEYRATGTLNLPIVKDLLGVRVSGGYSAKPGYLRDRAGNQDFNDSNGYFVRGKATFTPASNIEVRGMAWLQRSRGKPNGSDANYLAPAPYPSFYPGPPASTAGLITGLDALSNNDFDLFNGALDWDLGPVKLYSSTSQMTWTINARDPIFQSTSVTRIRNFSQETRLASNYASVFQWSVGGIYTDINQRDFASLPAFGFPNLVELVGSEQYALFGEGHLKPAGEALELIGGIRYFHDRRYIEDQGNIVLARKYQSFNKTTWRANASYHFDHGLVYASASSGFRSGGFNFGLTLAFAPPGTVPVNYKPESVTAYEVGGKIQPFGKDLTVQLAAYYNDFNDIITSGTLPIGFASKDNAGKAKALGIEWQIDWQATPELMLSTSGNLNDSNYRKSTASLGILAGDRISFVPAAQVSGAVGYRKPVATDTSLFFNANATYTSRRPDYTFVAGAGRLKVLGDPYVSVDLRAGVEASRWSLFAYASNLLNQRRAITKFASTSVSFTPFGLEDNPYTRPRVIGVGATFKY